MSTADNSPNQQSVEVSNEWDHPHADVIIRSSDGVDFPSYKLLLSLASPFFSGMFQTPQTPCKGGDDEDWKDGLPVVAVTEDSCTLKKLLRLLRSAGDLGESLDDVRLLVGPALKYDMAGIMEVLRKRLRDRQFLEDAPFTVYAIACRCRFEAEAKLAATYTLRQKIPGPFTEDWEYIPGAAHYRLIAYHKACGDVASQLGTDVCWTGTGYEYRAWNRCEQCPEGTKSFIKYIDQPFGRPTERRLRPRAWWTEYMTRAGEELEDRPWRGILTDQAIALPYLVRATECQTCRKSAITDMNQFRLDFEQQVEQVTAEVILEVKF